MSDELLLEFEFTSFMAPVQAEGTIAGRAFYFRARTQRWELTVAENPGDDPAALDAASAAVGVAWYRTGEIPGGPFAASYVPLDEASSIIRSCAREYIAGRNAIE